MCVDSEDIAAQAVRMKSLLLGKSTNKVFKHCLHLHIEKISVGSVIVNLLCSITVAKELKGAIVQATGVTYFGSTANIHWSITCTFVKLLVRMKFLLRKCRKKIKVRYFLHKIMSFMMCKFRHVLHGSYGSRSYLIF